MFSEDHDPWCATDLDDFGVMKVDKFKTCFDEDKITYDGGSEAQPCELPFLMDRQYYEPVPGTWLTTGSLSWTG